MIPLDEDWRISVTNLRDRAYSAGYEAGKVVGERTLYLGVLLGTGIGVMITMVVCYVIWRMK